MRAFKKLMVNGHVGGAERWNVDNLAGARVTVYASCDDLPDDDSVRVRFVITELHPITGRVLSTPNQVTQAFTADFDEKIVLPNAPGRRVAIRVTSKLIADNSDYPLDNFSVGVVADPIVYTAGA